MRWTVVVAHHRRMVAEGIGAALGRYPAIVPVATVSTASEAERQGERCDAVALDADLPGVEGAAVRLRRRGVRVVYLDGAGSDRDQEGIRRVSLQAPIAHLASALVPGIRTVSGTSKLTSREREILGLLAQGLAAKQVGRSLGISPKTVEHHKARIFAKLRVSNQTAAVSVVLSELREGAKLTA